MRVVVDRWWRRGLRRVNGANVNISSCSNVSLSPTGALHIAGVVAAVLVDLLCIDSVDAHQSLRSAIATNAGDTGDMPAFWRIPERLGKWQLTATTHNTHDLWP